MRNFFVKVLKYLTKSIELGEDQRIPSQPAETTKENDSLSIETPIFLTEMEKDKKKPANTSKNKKSHELTVKPFDFRDMIEIMEYPFLSISKNRTAPIHYESSDGSIKIKVSCHPPYYVASIYDWDIIMFVESKMQEIINSNSDIPPRTLIVPRNELIRAIHRHAGKTTEREIEAALNRLNSTLIETTVRNEDYRYRGGFGFLDSWGYTDRKDIKQFQITLSQWLYDGICKKGSLLKIRPEYLEITSGLKRFLYKTARKHVGTSNNYWIFSIDTLYEKSASQREFKKFKYDLKKAVFDNDIPEYFLEWIEENNKTSVRFTNKIKELKKILSQEQ